MVRTRLSAAWASLTRPFARAASTLANDVGWSIVRGSQPTDYQHTGRTVRVQGWERHPIVQACARVIADQIAAVGVEVYRTAQDGDVSVLPSHPAVQLLTAPGAAISGHRLMARTGVHLALYGNAFWRIVRQGDRIGVGKPVGLVPIHPERIRWVVTDGVTDTPIAWDIADGSGRITTYPAADVVHIPDLDASEDGVFGFPRAAAAIAEITGDSEMTQYVRTVILNSGAPGIAVLTEGVHSLADLKAAEDAWHQKFVERGQRGRTKFVAGVKDVKVIGFNLKDLEVPALRAVTREVICAAFGVDPRLVSVASAAKDGGLSGAQYGEARRRLEQQTCRPLRAAIEGALNLHLTPEYGYVFARFSPDAIADLLEDPKERSERIRAEVAATLRSVEEGRRAIGLPEQMDGGHLVAVPSTTTLTPAKDRGKAPEPAPAPAAAAKPDAAKEQPADARASAARPLTRVLRRGVALSAEQRQELWRAFDVRATRDESAYERTALLLFDAERDGVARALADATDAQPRSRAEGDDPPADPFIAAAEARIVADYAPGGAYHEAWLERYRALVSESVRVAGEGVADSVGLSFTLENPVVQAAVRRRVTQLAGNVTQTTVEAIRAAIATGRASGMGVKEIARLIDETTFGAITRTRAVTIARTETVGALNEGEHLAALESGVLQSKEWLTQGDGRVRDGSGKSANHKVLDGVRVAIDQAYPNGLQYPHAPGSPAKEVVKCRCTQLFYDEEAPQ